MSIYVHTFKAMQLYGFNVMSCTLPYKYCILADYWNRIMEWPFKFDLEIIKYFKLQFIALYYNECCAIQNTLAMWWFKLTHMSQYVKGYSTIKVIIFSQVGQSSPFQSSHSKYTLSVMTYNYKEKRNYYYNERYH